MKNLFDKIAAKITDKIDLKVVEILRAEIVRLELKPGDMIVLKSKFALTSIVMEHLKKHMEKIFPDHEHKIIMLEKDLDLVVLIDNRKNTYHLRDGWFFSRLSSGDVAIEKHKTDDETSPLIAYINIPPNEWASIVAQVSVHGDFMPYFQQALDFHNGTEPSDNAT